MKQNNPGSVLIAVCDRYEQICELASFVVPRRTFVHRQVELFYPFLLSELGALGLVVNLVVLWNTIYMDAALNQRVAEGYVARLSPLGSKHVNMLGRYAFSLPEFVARGELRPLRDPQKADPGES